MGQLLPAYFAEQQLKLFFRYEFQQYETALCLASMPLESKSVTSGYKDFIAVGTIITRGEDLATRGAVSTTFAAKTDQIS